MTERSTSRRSPAPDERIRDAERSKRLLLDAAVIEFAAHGFGGARVSDIAARAGVNKQLISYYFGGKQGLYDAIGERWFEADTQRATSQGKLPEVVAEYARISMSMPNLTRLLIRQGIDRGDQADDDPRQTERFAQQLHDFRRRQADGELSAELDPAAVSMAVFAMAAAPVTFPQLASALGIDPTDPAFIESYASQVAAMVAHLGQPT